MRAAMDMIIMLSTLALLWLLTILDPLHSLVLFRWDPKVTALFAPVAPSMCSNLKTWYHNSKDGVGIQRKSSQTLMFVAYSASNWSHSFLSIGIAILSEPSHFMKKELDPSAVMWCRCALPSKLERSRFSWKGFFWTEKTCCHSQQSKSAQLYSETWHQNTSKFHFFWWKSSQPMAG